VTLFATVISDLFGFLKNVNRKNVERNKRLVSLEARVAVLEARPIQKWAGTYIEGTSYAEASLVTRSGGLWCAMKATTTTPGKPDSDWRLIVKAGGA
jgi:hypothetical protein